MNDGSPTPGGAPDEESLEFVPEDAPLSALLATLPRRPAPPGFRDAVLAAIEAETPSIERAAEPLPPAGGSRLRRAARFAGGVALTAAALGLAALLFPLASEEAREVAGESVAPADAAAPAPRLDPASAGAARDGDAYVGREEAEEFDSAMEDEIVVLMEADAFADETLEAERYGRTVASLGSNEQNVRVVRVTSTSLLSNQLAVRQFESAAIRNAIPRRAVEVLTGGNRPFDDSAFKPDADADGTDERGAGGLGDSPLEALPEGTDADVNGVIGVLVVAEPERIAATLRDFRADLVADELTAGNRIAESDALRTRVPFAIVEQIGDDFDGTSDRLVEPSSEPEPGAAPASPAAGGAGHGLGGGAFGAPPERRRTDAESRVAGGVDAGRAGGGPPRYQMRVAPPLGGRGPAEFAPPAAARTADPRPPRAEDQGDDPPVPSGPADDPPPGVPPQSLQRKGEGESVPVLLLFEPPAAAAEPAPR